MDIFVFHFYDHSVSVSVSVCRLNILFDFWKVLALTPRTNTKMQQLFNERFQMKKSLHFALLFSVRLGLSRSHAITETACPFRKHILVRNWITLARFYLSLSSWHCVGLFIALNWIHLRENQLRAACKFVCLRVYVNVIKMIEWSTMENTAVFLGAKTHHLVYEPFNSS